jgi:bifunctional enzyme CysN/CysC
MPTFTPVTIDAETLLREHRKKELVRILTCGNVDDGKSTLIGRLLLDAGLLASDALQALEADSKRYGTTGGAIDPALLMDGLQAEREQGITIDVSHRYFFTEKRTFILADVPGHAQYTRNMATAASTADMVVVLIDATKGVTEQTYRHTAIIALLGIRHVLVTVNKMDLVGYDEATFDRIRTAFGECCARFDFTDLHFIPVSALIGDNVVTGSTKMPWYRGGTLMHLLETVNVASDRNLIDFRFPVQVVLRPDATFRGFAGTVSSGTVRPGDNVVVFPSRKQTKVRSIETFDGPLKEAFAGQAVTLTLMDEIDVSRGDVLAHAQNIPTLGNHCEAMIVWMGEEPLVPGGTFFLRLGRKETLATVNQIRYELDVRTHHRKDVGKLPMNGIGRCALTFHQPIAFDGYARNRAMGSFVLMDRVTNATVGAGMVLDRKGEDRTMDIRQRWQREPRSRTLVKEFGAIMPKERERQWKQKPVTLLFTGLSGAGKSTIAHLLEKKLFAEGHVALVLDAENVRLGLNRDLGFSIEERAENVRRVMEVAKLLNDAGVIALCALVAPTEEIRGNARELIGSDQFLLIYCDAPLETCKKRHTKELYARAKEEDVPGVSSAYETPKDADLVLKSGEEGAEKCAEKVMTLLRGKGIVKRSTNRTRHSIEDVSL